MNARTIALLLTLPLSLILSACGDDDPCNCPILDPDCNASPIPCNGGKDEREDEGTDTAAPSATAADPADTSAEE